MRPRIVLAVLAVQAALAFGAGGGATAARADSPSQASAQAKAIQSQIDQIDQQMSQASAEMRRLAAQLQALDQQLTDAQQKIDAIQAQIDADQQRDDQLKSQLNDIARISYERQGAWLPEILHSGSLTQLWNNLATARIVDDQEQTLRLQVEDVERQDNEAKNKMAATLASLDDERQQAATLEAVAQMQMESLQANRQVLSAQEIAALKSVTYQPVPGGTFTPDTDLRVVPKVDEKALDAFFTHTAFAGLASDFVNSGQQYHVNPLYLVAHAIEESAFGTSDLAVYKHNLFGMGANDRNPYGDAMTFPSFAAAIDYQAKFVSENYLDPSGKFYHGPTLRGMNVDYASDPNWADKIARIYHTLPNGNDTIPTS